MLGAAGIERMRMALALTAEQEEFWPAIATELHALGKAMKASAKQNHGKVSVDKYTIDAYWLGTAMSGMSGITLARPLQVEGKPVTHVENYCATGSEAVRGAAYAVASGAYDIAMAVGVEKVKDGGYQGLAGAAHPPTDGTGRTLTADGRIVAKSRRADRRSQSRGLRRMEKEI